jgi:amidase
MPLLPGNEDPGLPALHRRRRLPPHGPGGTRCVEAAPPVDGAQVSQAFFTTYCAGVAGELKFAEGYLGRPAHPDDVEPTTWLMGMIGRTSFSAGDFSLAIRQLQAMSRDVHRFMEGFDCYLTPTAGKPPGRPREPRPAGAREDPCRSWPRASTSRPR